MSLLSLPPDPLTLLLQHCDLPTLLSLSQTCRHLHHHTLLPSLWTHLLTHRFRVSPRPRFRTSAPRSPLAVYRQWHLQRRMPSVRGRSAPLGSHFAVGELYFPNPALVPNVPALPFLPPSAVRPQPPPSPSPCVLGWVTVSSASDCRVRSYPAGLALRIVVQNIAEDPVTIRLRDLSVSLRGDANLRLPVQRLSSPPPALPQAQQTQLAQAPAPPARAYEDGLAIVDRAGDPACSHSEDRRGGSRGGGRVAVNACEETVWLERDDYAVLAVRVWVEDTVHEVDVLERLRAVHVPVVPPVAGVGSAAVAAVVTLELPFDTARIWELYEHMPGDWWVRKDLAAGSSRQGQSAPGL